FDDLCHHSAKFLPVALSAGSGGSGILSPHHPLPAAMVSFRGARTRGGVVYDGFPPGRGGGWSAFRRPPRSTRRQFGGMAVAVRDRGTARNPAGRGSTGLPSGPS